MFIEYTACSFLSPTLLYPEFIFCSSCTLPNGAFTTNNPSPKVVVKDVEAILIIVHFQDDKFVFVYIHEYKVFNSSLVYSEKKKTSIILNIRNKFNCIYMRSFTRILRTNSILPSEDAARPNNICPLKLMNIWPKYLVCFTSYNSLIVLDIILRKDTPWLRITTLMSELLPLERTSCPPWLHLQITIPILELAPLE